METFNNWREFGDMILSTFGGIWEWFSNTPNSLLENAELPDIAETVLQWLINAVGIGNVTMLMLILGGTLTVVLLYKLLKFFVGLATGS